MSTSNKGEEYNSTGLYRTRREHNTDDDVDAALFHKDRLKKLLSLLNTIACCSSHLFDRYAKSGFECALAKLDNPSEKSLSILCLLDGKIHQWMIPGRQELRQDEVGADTNDPSWKATLYLQIFVAGTLDTMIRDNKIIKTTSFILSVV